MANPIADRPEEALVYRPLSGLAIGGLAIAVVYTAVVFLSLVMGLTRRQPFLLPDWMIVAPLAGALLSLLARRQIRASEGTRAGGAVASWGLWLSVLAGLGYHSYSYFTGLAVRQQADRFLTEKGPDSGFFQYLIEGDVNRAFLLTRTPDSRRSSNPADERSLERHDLPEDPSDPRGPLSYFRDSELVRIFRQPSDPPVLVEAGGLRSWSFTKGGYRVERNYRIVTAEGVYELPFVVHCFDGEAPGEGRKWMLEWYPNAEPLKPKWTTFGEKIERLRGHARRFTLSWIADAFAQDVSSQEQVLRAYLGTRPPEEREALSERMKWTQGGAPPLAAARDFGRTAALVWPSGLAALPIPIPDHLQNRLLLPGFDDFFHGRDWLSTDRLRGKEEQLDQRLHEALAPIWRELGVVAPVPKLIPREADWKKADGRLSMTFYLDLIVTLADRKRFTVMARLTLDADSALDPEQAEALGQWRIVRLECTRAVPMP